MLFYHHNVYKVTEVIGRLLLCSASAIRQMHQAPFEHCWAEQSNTST